MALKKPRAFWPLTVGSTNNKLNVDATPATVASATYVDPEAFAQAVLDAINVVLGAPDATYTISSAGKVTFSRVGAFALDFSVANSVGSYIGFEAEVRGSAESHVATEQVKNGWWSTVAVFAEPPFSEIRHGGATVALNNKAQFVEWARGEVKTIDLAWLPAEKTYIAKESAGTKYGAIQRLFREGYSKFRWWPDATVVGTYDDMALEPKQAFERFDPPRQYQSVELYRMALRVLKYVA